MQTTQLNINFNRVHKIIQNSRKNITQGKLKKSYGIGELFCGAGGLALGASLARYKTKAFHHVWATDMDKDACDTFKKNIDIPSHKVFCEQIEILDFKKLDPIEGLMFGFPCNDFSVVGKHKGIQGRYGSLFSYGAYALKLFKPLFFLAENVGGLQSANKNSALPLIKKSFEKEGYDVFINICQFENYGVAQKRKRILFIGFRKDLKARFSNPPKLNKTISAKEALKNIPNEAKNHEYTKQHPRVVERLKFIKPGENAFSANLPNHLKLKMKSNAKISQIYKRLKSNNPSYTITGSGGGGTHVYHWKEHRALTNRERARLQSFPDDFEFLGSKESVRKQIGMAIPPKGIAVVLKQVLKTLYKLNV